MAFVEGAHLFSFSSDAVSPLLWLVTVYSSLNIISIAWSIISQENVCLPCYINQSISYFSLSGLSPPYLVRTSERSQRNGFENRAKDRNYKKKMKFAMKCKVCRKVNTTLESESLWYATLSCIFSCCYFLNIIINRFMLDCEFRKVNLSYKWIPHEYLKHLIIKSHSAPHIGAGDMLFSFIFWNINSTKQSVSFNTF